MSAWQTNVRQLTAYLVPFNGGFWRWWKQALLVWLPLHWRRQLGFTNTRILVCLHADGLAVMRQHEDVITQLTDAPWPISPDELTALLPQSLRALPRYWLLPAEHVLRCPLRLPAVTMNQIYQVTRFEIDRQTPFQSEQVYHDAVIIQRRQDNQLDVELVVVPRQCVDGPQGVAPEWRGALAGIDVITEYQRPLGVNLLPPAKRLATRDPLARWTMGLIVIALVLVGVAGLLFINNRHQAADQLRDQIAADSQRLRLLSSEREQLTDLIDGARFFAQQRNRHPPAVAIWNALTQRLPMNTFLEKFSLEGEQIQLIGMSHEAASLIRRLEGEPMWQKPTLTGVLQSDAGQGLDRFTITIGLTQTPADEGADATSKQ